ncbi:zinc-dependent dehydrogenase [Neobacillus sp. MER 74]|uniref:zinc-dependent dehydrogenase n=1 Tax=Neobacillus sp. MER 74 TaxID=2939566 RepID=UPI00203BE430|nr:zinc-dependent dehydrogenase [Neobacillus sp. MER 74]MCM3118077.1 zinc-dependent dehydrogenase [Neobacillus sp. MER 74]
MKAAFYYGIGDIRVEDVPIPEIQKDEILVKVKACSVCGTDNRIYRHGHFKVPEGMKRVLGHETAGKIVKVGTAVKGFRGGERVALPPNVGCGTCKMCIKGFNQLCPNYQAFGISMDGGFAEYVKIPAFAVNNVIKIPDHVSYEEAAIAEPLSCVLHAYEAHKTVPGDTVLIIGPGPIGALHVMINKLAGGRIIVAGRSNARLEQIKQYGADIVINNKESDLKEEINKITNGFGVDVVITSNSDPEMQKVALEVAGYHGRVSLFGGLPKGKEEVSLNTNLIHYKELLVTATTGSSLLDVHKAMEMISTGIIDVKSLITATFSIADTVAAFDYAAQGQGMKALITTEL